MRLILPFNKKCWRLTLSTKKIPSIVQNSKKDNGDNKVDKNGSTETERTRAKKLDLVLEQEVNEKKDDVARTEDQMATKEVDQKTDNDKEATGEDDKKATVKDDTRETNDADKKASILTNKTVKMI